MQINFILISNFFLFTMYDHKILQFYFIYKNRNMKLKINTLFKNKLNRIFLKSIIMLVK